MNLDGFGHVGLHSISWFADFGALLVVLMFGFGLYGWVWWLELWVWMWVVAWLLVSGVVGCVCSFVADFGWFGYGSGLLTVVGLGFRLALWVCVECYFWLCL